MKAPHSAGGPPLGNYGGGQVYVSSLVDGLLARGESVALVTAGAEGDGVESLEQAIRGQRLRVYRLPDPQQVGAERFQAAFDAVLREIRPGVVHANALKAESIEACRRAGVPCVVTAHHGGLVCPAGALLDWRDRICDRTVTEAHCLKCCVRNIRWGAALYPFWRAVPRFLRPGIGALARRLPFVPFLTPVALTSLSIRMRQREIEVLGKADRIIAPSQAIREALERNGMEREKIRVVPHGIPLLERRPFEAGLGQRPVRFFYLGRINRVKGLHVLLEALRPLSPESYELHVFGEAYTKPERRYDAFLRRRSAGMPVTWHGKVDRAALADSIATCDVMVHPAICLEVFGLNVLESLSVGRPVVATRCGGPEEIVRDGVDGYLVPPNDAEALRSVLQRFIDRPGLAADLAGNIGPVRSLEEHVEDVVAVYREVMRDGAGGQGICIVGG